ncbi:MAG: CoA transferase [Lachnospiraceae bacterium]|nr:CoA transferase [Lachnospiraceae bacterium]
MGPLTGYKVLDLTRTEAVPFATMIMADLGAEVIKLEPSAGDPSRNQGIKKNGYSAAYTSVNRGKKSVFMDLANEEQRALFYEMVKTADAVVHNAEPGEMEALGCGYEDLLKINPKIVYTVVTPYGEEGPLAGIAGNDTTVLAYSGLMSMVGDLGGEPQRVGVNISDTISAFYACIGTLAALYSGESRKVSVSELDAVFAANEAAAIRYDMAGAIPKPQGNKHPSTVPFGNYTCKDGRELIVNITTDDQFRNFVTAMDAPEVAEGKFSTASERVNLRDETEKVISGLFAKFDSEDLKKRFDAVNAPYGVINEVDMISESEHIAARNMLVDVTYPDGTVIKTAGTPLKMTDMEDRTSFTASPAGYDTLAVAAEYIGEEKARALYPELL